MMFAVYAAGLIFFTILFTREVIAPASGANCDERWRIFSGALNAANIITVIAFGLAFDKIISEKSIFDLSDKIDFVSGGVLAFLVSSFVAYWWHRLTHYSNFLWRSVHQLHHSPSRIESLTAFYVHPLDTLFAALLNSSIAYFFLGVSAYSAALSLLLVVLFNLFAHADQKSPVWLGYITQRPEMHRVHHESGSHKSNYGMPIWDILFGTWANPASGPKRCGFSLEKEKRIRDMLLFKDVQG